MATLSQKDQSFIWHPFTQHQNADFPIPIQSAKGSWLYGEDGAAYLDVISSWWTCLHGHCHPVLTAALQKQAQTLDHVLFAGFTHEPAVTLAENLLAEVGQPFSKVFFSDNGSTAVEVALKQAYQYWHNQGETQRTKFLAFSGGYHGDTFGAMAVGQGSHFFTPFHDLCFEVEFLPYPETWVGDKELEDKEHYALAYIKQVLEDYAETCAALIIEPLLQGASGMKIARPAFIRKLHDLVKSYGLLIIYDEVAVGFGRLGSTFAFQQIDRKPDFLCLSKGITGGYLPLSVTITTETIFEAFLSNDSEKAFLHGHSYTANPLACAVANASWEVLKSQDTQKAIKRIENNHLKFMDDCVHRMDLTKCRMLGTVCAVDITPDYLEDKGFANIKDMKKYCLANGVNFRPLGNTFYLMPPYCITDEELDKAYKVILR